MLYMETPYSSSDEIPWSERKDCAAYTEKGLAICEVLEGGRIYYSHKEVITLVICKKPERKK